MKLTSAYYQLIILLTLTKLCYIVVLLLMIPVQPVSSREMDLLCNVGDWKSHSYCASGVTTEDVNTGAALAI